MRINIAKEFDLEAAKIVGAAARKIKTIAFPTGKTPVGMYRELKKMKLDWSGIKIFMLDVNYPQNPEEPDSFFNFAEKYLPTDKFNILDSSAKDPGKECREYEEKIKAAGGLDLAVLGIGPNGHIAFNEPGTSFESLTHKAKLAGQPFEYGLTMGIKTIMGAKKIILLAKGKNKAGIVKQALTGPITEQVPASGLQKHPDCTFILDREAAVLLQ